MPSPSCVFTLMAMRVCFLVSVLLWTCVLSRGIHADRQLLQDRERQLKVPFWMGPSCVESGRPDDEPKASVKRGVVAELAEDERVVHRSDALHRRKACRVPAKWKRRHSVAGTAVDGLLDLSWEVLSASWSPDGVAPKFPFGQ